MTELNIDIKRTGFPVTVGGIEFFFSTSEDNILKFMTMQDDPEGYVAQFEDTKKRAEKIKIPKGDEPVKVETYKEVIELQKSAGRIIFDVLLGKGSFDTLYAVYPDVKAINDLVEPVAKVIADGLNEYYEKEYKKVQANKSTIAKKKTAKRKTKK